MVNYISSSSFKVGVRGLDVCVCVCVCMEGDFRMSSSWVGQGGGKTPTKQ